jgi:hypothetical protein
MQVAARLKDGMLYYVLGTLPFHLCQSAVGANIYGALLSFFM